MHSAGNQRVSNQKAKKDSGLWEGTKGVVQVLLIALIVRTLLFQPFSIPSGSLIPTLLVGDYLFVSKYAYGYSRYSIPFGPPIFSGRIWGAEPERGDVVVFKLPTDNSTDYIKRVIGLPGDRIQMISGILHINGQSVLRERTDDFVIHDAFGRSIAVPQYLETLPNGVTHRIIELAGDVGPWDNTPVYTVPPGHFFMMGDNRDNSDDSRDLSNIGYVPFENLVGRAGMIFFSIDDHASAWRIWEWPWTVRWNRLLQPVE
jgi:signal peptidase I